MQVGLSRWLMEFCCDSSSFGFVDVGEEMDRKKGDEDEHLPLSYCLLEFSSLISPFSLSYCFEFYFLLPLLSSPSSLDCSSFGLI